VKRLLVIFLIALFCLGLLAGCGPKKEQPKEETTTTEQPTTEQVTPDTTQPPATDTTQPSGK
jgi:PBP1b-binding outer membrane lipoprotein LpoB